MVPNRPSWMTFPQVVNAAIDTMQEGVRASQDLIDKWQGQDEPLPDLKELKRKDQQTDGEINKLRQELRILKEMAKSWEGTATALRQMQTKIEILEKSIKYKEGIIDLLQKEAQESKEWREYTFVLEQQRQDERLKEFLSREAEKLVDIEAIERKRKDDELQREIDKANDWQQKLRDQIAAESRERKQEDNFIQAKIKAVESKIDYVTSSVNKLAADLIVKTKEIAQFRLELAAFKAGLPVLIKSIVWSIILSAAFNAVIDGIIGAFNYKAAQDAWNTALKALGLAREAKDDARAAATIAVKAEGKADTAIAEIEWTKQTALAAMKRLESEIEWTKQTALAAMKRLENLINSEIKFLTESAKNALLRLQGRIENLEKYVGNLASIITDLKSLVTNLNSEFTKLQSLTAAKIKDLTAAVEALKTNIFKELEKLKPLVNKIPKILGDIAVFAVQIGAIWAAINGIKALLGRFTPGGTVVTNNYYYTTNNYTQPDLALLKKIDATTTTNLGVSIGTQAIAETINTKCGDQIYGKGGKAIGIGGKLVSGFNWLIIDRAMNMLTLAVTIHNAAMLSQNIIATLTQAMQNVVELIGVKDDQDNPVEISTLINNSITNFVKNVVGKENYDYWIKQWNYYNRIYQASANLFSSLLSMGDTIVNALQVISGQNAKVANALKSWSVVGNAYGWMNITPNFNNPLLTKLNSLEETASMVEQVTQEPLNVKSAKEGLESASKELADSLVQEQGSKQGKEVPEAKTVKENEDAKKTESKGIAKLLEDAFEDD